MLLFFDTETTGLPAKGHYDNPRHPSTPRLVELAALLYNHEGKRHGELEAIVKPDGFIIPDAASNVHGITTERALAEGQDLHHVINKFIELGELAEALVAHNIQYDWLILRKELLVTRHDQWSVPNELHCTKTATTNLCRIPSPWGGFKWPTLMEAYKHLFGEEFSGAHGALADVEACARIFFKLKGIDIELNQLKQDEQLPESNSPSTEL